MSNNYISQGSEWTFDLLHQYDSEISRIANNYKLDTYPNQIEVITAEQMMDAYSSVGMPLGYPHWSYGKQLLNIEKNYKRGNMGLAYEIVINSNPCIAYLMEENTMTMQALVIAHAAYGHNSFFKGNYLFRSWTNADSIVDYLLFAKNYIATCEERYGIEDVELILDSCHALMNYGVDRYKRPPKLSLAKEAARQEEREEYMQSQVNLLWRTIPVSEQEKVEMQDNKRFPREPQENILYFIEKNAPLLEPWQRELVRIVRKMAQYFYPQRQTQVMNEGWATFWHYTIMNEMYNKELINDGAVIEFLTSHTNVVSQPGFDSPYYSGISPYALGFNMMKNLRDICENPTDEDKAWFPDIAGSDWLKTLDFAMRNFKDESFISQFLSPKIIRQFKYFSVFDNDHNPELHIDAIHNEEGYHAVRQQLAEQYNLSSNEPNIQVFNVDLSGNRSLTLHHVQHNRKPLEKGTQEVLKHIYRLWGFPVHLESFSSEGKVTASFHCPETVK